MYIAVSLTKPSLDNETVANYSFKAKGPLLLT